MSIYFSSMYNFGLFRSVLLLDLKVPKVVLLLLW